MSHRLTVPEFLAVRRALRAGRRHTEIARDLNLSVWTIARIDDQQRYQLDPVTDDELPVDDAPPDYLAQNLRRCPGCGAMVYLWPCRACQMATLTEPVPPAPEVDDEASEPEPRSTTQKRQRWRRKRIREFVFGEVENRPRS
jgi:hypothetical protein